MSRTTTRAFCIVGAIGCVAMGVGAVLWRRSARPAAAMRTVEVVRGRFAPSVLLRGVLQSTDAVPVAVQTPGRIIEIVAQGASVRKGDMIVRMDDGDAREQIRGLELAIEKKQVQLKTLRARAALIEAEQAAQRAVDEAALAHAQLEEREELAKPTAADRRQRQVSLAKARLDVADAEAELEQQQRMHDKGYVSAAAVEPQRRSLTNARERVAELEAEVRIRAQGISAERRVELRRAVERAQAALARSGRRRERKLREVTSQIREGESRIRQREHELKRYREQVENAVVRARRDGVVKVRRYRDWRAGGASREYRAGAELRPQDIIADIIDPRKMGIALAVNQADWVGLRPGLPVRVCVPAFPEHRFSGTLKRLGAVGRDRNAVDPTVDGGGRSEVTMFQAEVDFDGGGVRFRPGMSALVEVLLSEPVEGLIIPLPAVDTTATPHTVRLRDGGGVRRIAIRGRPLDTRTYLVKDGLREGQILAFPRSGEAQ